MSATNNQLAARGLGHAAVVALLLLAATSARAQMLDPPAAAAAVAGPTAPTPACKAPAELARFTYLLRHTARRLASGGPLVIVAIGSSSTRGAGASSAASSYPSRLAVELQQHFPGIDISVLNRGVNGEETAQMLARFESGVLAAKPDLVLWQIGTNAVLRDHPLKPHAALLREGIADLKEAGADVVLMDMQYAPRVIAKPERQEMEDQIALIAKQESVDLFGRFAIMRDWHESQHIPFETFVAPDQLHMNDWGYSCIAKVLAGAIAEAATRPVASAARR
jgi:acyl-CoA thioesterase I